MSKHAARANLATRVWRHPSTFAWIAAFLGGLAWTAPKELPLLRFAMWLVLGAYVGWRAYDFRNIKGDLK